MGLFGKSSRQLINDAVRKSGGYQQKEVECPNCHNYMRVTTVGRNNTVTCRHCGIKIKVP